MLLPGDSLPPQAWSMVLPGRVRQTLTSDSLQLSEGKLPTPKPHVSLFLTPLLGSAAVRLREKIRENPLWWSRWQAAFLQVTGNNFITSRFLRKVADVWLGFTTENTKEEARAHSPAPPAAWPVVGAQPTPWPCQCLDKASSQSCPLCLRGASEP